MRFLYSQWPPHAFAYKTALDWIDPANPIRVIGALTKKNGNAGAAIDSLPVPSPQPPITPANAQVISAEQQFAQSQLMKKSIKGTIYAPDTGGFKPGEAGYPGNPGVPAATYKK